MDAEVTEAVVLAGGLGTRLRSVIGALPKPLAPIGHRPFLHYLLSYLYQNGIRTVVLSVGYQWELIQAAFGTEYIGIELKYAVEQEQLGTGGGMRLALGHIKGERCFVINGDTYFDIDLQSLARQHKGVCTLATKRMTATERYGTIDCNAEGVVTQLHEKRASKGGIVNAGSYCVEREIVNYFPERTTFSFETDFLEKQVKNGNIRSVTFDNYFMDIGIPKDCEQFEHDHSTPLHQLGIDSNWTLFLDRDGVINERLVNDYVKALSELKILEGVPEAMGLFSQLFRRVLVVTNQQGIGKGKMTASDVATIHAAIRSTLTRRGGKIERFYVAPQTVAEKSNDRKPGVGMGLKAQSDYPDIDFSTCLMIGDSESDIDFGVKLGMKTIRLTALRNTPTKADYIYTSLREVAHQLARGGQ